VTAIIRPGRIIDGVADETLAGVEVVVEGDRVAVVRPSGSEQVGDAVVVDVPDATLMPGMFDLHIHVFNKGQPEVRPKPPETILELAVRGFANVSELLDTGVTTTRDAGSRGNLAIELRDLIAAGRVRGPRFFASGNPIAVEGRAFYYSPPTYVSGVVETQAATRRQLRAGADWIKIMATAGVGGGTGNLIGEPGWPELTEAELRAAVTEVHMANRKIMTHAIGTSGIKAALRAGVDSIEHCNYLDDEAIEMMVEGDVSMVPTLIITRNLGEYGAERGFEINVVERAKRTLAAGFESVKKAFAAGVRIGVGSDVDLDETAAQEVRMLIEAGLAPMDAIRAATSKAAEVLDLQDDVGTIEAGKIADLILLDGDPIADPFALDRVTHVFQSGNLVKEPA
jgi:imidazolonepropionase-like amidohydrolase